MKDSKIVIRALGIIERHDRNTGQRLAEEILEIMKRFSLAIPNIYTFTTDNGANFLKAGLILRIEQELAVDRLETETSGEAQMTASVVTQNADER